MKIGVLCYPTFGGSGVVATELGIALANQGHKVHFISYKQPVRLTSFNENIYFHEVVEPDYALFEQVPYESSLVSTLVDVVTFHDLDLLHVHYAIPHAAVAYMARQILSSKGIHIPVVTTLHGTDITLVGKSKTFAPIVEFSINQSNAVTCVSQSLKEQTIEFFDIETDISVIPNFIDFSRFQFQDKSHFKKVLSANGERILIHVSNFREVKRVPDVIEVFAELRKKVPSRLLLVGDGPERKECERRCRSLGLCDEISFLGKQQAVEELLSIADLMILPSEQESFGLAALEALACRVPLVTSNVGGLPEVNIHGKTGFLAPVGAVKEMADYAIKILENDEHLEQFKQRAFEHAQRFDIKQIMKQYEALYESLIVVSNDDEPS